MTLPKLRWFFASSALLFGMGQMSQSAVMLGYKEVKIITQPQEQMVALLGPAEMVVKAEGEGLSYQWLFRYRTIQGATNASYFITNVTTESVGPYQCIVNADSTTVLTDTVGLSAYAACDPNSPNTLTLWSFPSIWLGVENAAPDGNLLIAPPKNDSKPKANLERKGAADGKVYLAGLRRQSELPKFQFTATGTTNQSSTPPSVSPPTGRIGSLAGCGTYIGYVNFRKSGTPSGWQPIAGVAHSAQDPNRSDTCVQFVGSSFGNNGVGTGGFVNVTPATSASYQFTIYFTAQPLPTSTYSITLNGFYP